MNYTPERWVVLAMTMDNVRTEKVFAGWYGGYLGSDSWKLSSGITNVELSIHETYYTFINESGSVYKCYKQAYGMSAYMENMLARWKQELVTNNIDASIETVKEYEN